MDTGLQDLQREAKRVKPTEIRQLLDEFFREKAALRDRHMASARAVGQYDFNNTYQYVIGREEQHLAWVAEAIRQLGGEATDTPAPPAPPVAKTPDAQRALIAEDARALDEFHARWQQRLAPVSNARHKLLLDLIMGEVLEQARFFHQGAAGQVELLGRRTGGERTEGGVLPTRWVE